MPTTKDALNILTASRLYTNSCAPFIKALPQTKSRNLTRSMLKCVPNSSTQNKLSKWDSHCKYTD